MQNLDLDPDEQDKMRSLKLIGWFDALKPIMSKYERSKDMAETSWRMGSLV